MKIRYILDYQANKKNDVETVSDKAGQKLIYRAIAEKVTQVKKKK